MKRFCRWCQNRFKSVFEWDTQAFKHFIYLVLSLVVTLSGKVLSLPENGFVQPCLKQLQSICELRHIKQHYFHKLTWFPLILFYSHRIPKTVFYLMRKTLSLKEKWSFFMKDLVHIQSHLPLDPSAPHLMIITRVLTANHYTNAYGHTRCRSLLLCPPL